MRPRSFLAIAAALAGPVVGLAAAPVVAARHRRAELPPRSVVYEVTASGVIKDRWTIDRHHPEGEGVGCGKGFVEGAGSQSAHWRTERPVRIRADAVEGTGFWFRGRRVSTVRRDGYLLTTYEMTCGLPQVPPVRDSRGCGTATVRDGFGLIYSGVEDDSHGWRVNGGFPELTGKGDIRLCPNGADHSFEHIRDAPRRNATAGLLVGESTVVRRSGHYRESERHYTYVFDTRWELRIKRIR